MSTFDCVSSAELQHWLPAAQDVHATDGAEVWEYENGRTGALVTFDFFVGTPCMLSMSVAQRPRQTFRFEAARERQKMCMLP